MRLATAISIYAARPDLPAADYAKSHAGSKIASDISGKERRMIRRAVARALREGWSIDKLADRIQQLVPDAAVMTPERAELISHTELADARQESDLIQMRDTKAKYKTTGVGDPCELCLENNQAGPIPINEPFPSGHMRPPFHPACQCWLIRADEE